MGIILQAKNNVDRRENGFRSGSSISMQILHKGECAVNPLDSVIAFH